MWMGRKEWGKKGRLGEGKGEYTPSTLGGWTPPAETQINRQVNIIPPCTARVTKVGDNVPTPSVAPPMTAYSDGVGPPQQSAQSVDI